MHIPRIYSFDNNLCIRKAGDRRYYIYFILPTQLKGYIARMPFQEETLLIPGPEFEIDLPTIDACHPVRYARRLLVFRTISEEQRAVQLSALKTGLKALILRCPPLGGTLSRLPPAEAPFYAKEWRTIIPGSGLELVVRDLRKEMPSFGELERGGFDPGRLGYEKLVPVPKDVGSEGPACKVQFSAIEGGTILCWAMSHSVADGVGNDELLRLLAEATRLAGHDSGGEVERREVVGLDRSGVRNVKGAIPFDTEDHPGYRITPPPGSSSKEQQSHPFKAKNPEIPLLFTISPQSLAQLKKDATPPSPSWISTHDALAALLWRTQILIRRQRSLAAQNLPDSTLTTLFMPSDARRALNIENPYIGNVIYQLSATLPLSTLLSSSGLQSAAQAIRAAITAATPEKVKSYFGEVGKRWVEWDFLGSYDTTGVAMGTGWKSGGLYELDWGREFGKMRAYRLPDEAFNSIMPRLLRGGAEVLMSVMEDEVETVRECEDFMKYIE
jgi:hypothetical protein